MSESGAEVAWPHEELDWDDDPEPNDGDDWDDDGTADERVYYTILSVSDEVVAYADDTTTSFDDIQALSDGRA